MTTTLTPKKAFFAAMISMAQEDDKLDSREKDYLAKYFHEVYRETVEDAAKFVLDFKGTYRELITTISNSLNKEQKIATMAALYEMMWIDKRMDDEEDKLYKMYFDVFGLSQDIWDTIQICSNTVVEHNLRYFE
ncbi:MAG TPA: hypothetical protein DDX29_10835 [Clostridiales bacterium]|nr:hypothetical protein [Clostridiales bacterium]